MNILLIEPGELDDELCTTITGRRARHMREVLDAGLAQSLRAGVVGGKLGVAHVEGLIGDTLRIRFEALSERPPPSKLKLVLALPRPKALKRVLMSVTSLGIKDITLLNAYRVEKAYWSATQMREEYIRSACLLGLEQACDTVLPKIRIERLFKPFVQDRLPELIKGSEAYVGHPHAERSAPSQVEGCVTLAIGPEGGFIPYELELLQVAGFQPVRLGHRVLKTETAIAFLVGRFIHD